jgi:hypothetical protein
MGKDRIRYLTCNQWGGWRWTASEKMRVEGFQSRSLGTDEEFAFTEARRLNAEWDAHRNGHERKSRIGDYNSGTLGAAYSRFMQMREAERKLVGNELTFEQRRRDDWPRAWRWLGPAIGDMKVERITPEIMLELRAKISKSSEHEAHRAIKVFRALWCKLPTLGHPKINVDADPSRPIRNPQPQPRQAVWQYDDVRRFVEGAWNEGYHGLAAILAVTWDTMLSPIDVRTLKIGDHKRDVFGTYFGIARAKTGRAANGTLSPWSEQVLDAYLEKIAADPAVTLHAAAPLFWTRGGLATGPKGGRPWKPAPYTMDKLGKDYRKVRAIVFGPNEDRQLADMRRSGAVEATVGGSTGGDLSNKMANTISHSNFIHKTYSPAQLEAARRVDEARKRGRRALLKNSLRVVHQDDGDDADNSE